MTILLNLFLTLLIPNQITNHTDISKPSKPSTTYTSGHKFKTGDLVYVLAVHGLNLRVSPDPKSSKIKTIPSCDSVLVIGYDDPLVPMSVNEFKDFDIKGYWVKVKAGLDTGYVFDGYLSRYTCMRKEEWFSGYMDRYFQKLKADHHIKTHTVQDDELTTSYYRLPNGASHTISGSYKGLGDEWQIPDTLITKEEVYLLIRQKIKFFNPPIFTVCLNYDVTNDDSYVPKDGNIFFAEELCEENIFHQGNYVVYTQSCSD